MSTKPISGPIYTALEDGRLVRVQNSTKFIQDPLQSGQSIPSNKDLQFLVQQPTSSALQTGKKRLVDDKLVSGVRKKLKTCDFNSSIQSTHNPLTPTKFNQGTKQTQSMYTSPLNVSQSSSQRNVRDATKSSECANDSQSNKVAYFQTRVFKKRPQYVSSVEHKNDLSLSSTSVKVIKQQGNSTEESKRVNLKNLFDSNNHSFWNKLPKTHSPHYFNRQSKSGESKGSTPKSKYHNLLVPKNMNQLGDCLKSRLGRYHFGLTLNDPPCQFFHGVLKGASGQTLAAMFGDTDLISKLEKLPPDEIGHFLIDNTFAVSPSSMAGVTQVMTICLLIENMVIPLWYALISHPSKELYKRIIIEFHQHVLDWPFTSVLLNDDPDLCQAVLAVFPDAQLYGSWYHYCYNIWNEIRRNNLVKECTTNDALLSAVKLLFVVPYLPPTSDSENSPTMLDGLQLMRQLAEDQNLPEGFTNVLNYVELFWFNTVGCENFTMFGEHSKLQNHIEISQLSLLSFMQPDGNVWTLTHAFKVAAKSTNIEVTKYLDGQPHWVRKKRRGKKFLQILHKKMKKVLSGPCDVQTFLEQCKVYCEEKLDIFLHPFQPNSTPSSDSYYHMELWRIKINTGSEDKGSSS